MRKKPQMPNPEETLGSLDMDLKVDRIQKSSTSMDRQNILASRCKEKKRSCMILIPAELDRRIDKMVYEAKMKNIPLSRSGVVAQALQAYFAADLGESGNG